MAYGIYGLRPGLECVWLNRPIRVASNGVWGSPGYKHRPYFHPFANGLGRVQSKTPDDFFSRGAEMVNGADSQRLTRLAPFVRRGGLFTGPARTTVGLLSDDRGRRTTTTGLRCTKIRSRRNTNFDGCLVRSLSGSPGVHFWFGRLRSGLQRFRALLKSPREAGDTGLMVSTGASIAVF